jgi:hypothetical protein
MIGGFSGIQYARIPGKLSVPLPDIREQSYGCTDQREGGSR